MAAGPSENSVRKIFSGSVPQAFSDPLFVFLGFLLLYAATFDHSYFYDSVLYSGIIRSPLGLNPPAVVFEWNHFLWYPVTRSFYVLLRLLGFGGLSYEAIQWFNAGAGALGLAVFFSLLARVLSRRQALFWTLLAGMSAVYWSRATGAEPYLGGTLFTLLFCAALYRYFLGFSLAAFCALCAFAGLASGFHIANNILWAAAAAAALYHRRELARQAAILAGFFLAFALPYALIHGFFVKGGLARWWQWGSGLVNGVSPEGNPLGQFELNVAGHVVLPLRNLLVSFFHFTGPDRAAAAAAVVLLAVLAAFLSYSRHKDKPFLSPEVLPLAAAFGLPLAFFLALYSVWQPGNTIYWSTNVVLFSGLLAALLRGRTSAIGGPVPAAAAFLLVGLAAANNFARLVLPSYLGRDARPLIGFCGAVAYFTHPDSPVLISGGPLKVYIPYFANRERISIQLAILNFYADKKDPVEELGRILASYYAHAVPVYMTGDVLADRDLYAQWGFTGERLDALLKPYRPLKILRYEEAGAAGNTLYLLWPRRLGGAAQKAVFENLERAGMGKHAAAIKQLLARPG